jgi:predicted transposase/invertase (TIGR01784 family)
LRDVLNQVLKRKPGHLIEGITLNDSFNARETPDDKLSILDVKATDQAGHQYNVEMQMLPDRYYEKRVLYYGCRFHQQQLLKGEEYADLRPTVSISFLDHVRYSEIEDYHLHFLPLEANHHFAMTHDLEFHFLQLPKFNKTTDELVTGLDIWLYFLKHAEKMDTDSLPVALRNYPLIPQAVEVLKMLGQSEIERYESRRKALMDYSSGLRSATLEGEEKGLQKGEVIGRIFTLEQLLKRPQTSKEFLLALSLDELSQRADGLMNELLPRM